MTAFLPSSPREKRFFEDVKKLLLQSRLHAVSAINDIMSKTYWQIGKRIFEQEQNGENRAEYGSFLIKRLSAELAETFGDGFSVANLKNFRRFYISYPEREKSYTLCSQLSWSHIRLIIRIDNETERQYYIAQAHEQNWSVRMLERNIKSDSFHRLLAQSPLTVNKDPLPQYDIIKDPYVMEFLGLKGEGKFIEGDLEKAILSNIEKFLLELGRGFAFVERQMRICTETTNFYIDLVFYNFILKCFVLIDLKIDKLTHQDIGQMDMYVRMFDDLKRQPDDNPTIGIILCKDKDETLVKYSVLNEAKHIFASKYKLALPTETELKQALN